MPQGHRRNIIDRQQTEQSHRGFPWRLAGGIPFLCIFLALVIVGATAASADESESQPPAAPTPVEMEEGLNSVNSAIYEAELTNPKAAEELPHQELDREQALNLMEAVFGPLLQQPAGVFDELEVERFLSNNAAIVAPGDLPESTGPTIGSPPQDRYEGTTLLESTTPLRSDAGSGQSEVVDLGLEPAEGEVQPSNPLVEVGIPQQLGEGVELPEAGITVKLAGAPEDRTPTTIDQSVAAYPEVAQDTSLAVAPTPEGFETLTLLQSADAPTSQTFNLELPAGANLQPTDEGGAEVTHEGKPLLGVAPPTALDASGEEVPVSLTVSAGSLTLEVSPAPSTSWPVLVDPLYETYNWWNGITGLGGWGGWTNAAPNYYRADHATCTTNASPYTCQAGVTSNAPGLYIGALPGAVPNGSAVNWEFPVPRWAEEWEKYNRAPSSFITSLIFRNIGYWHRTDSSPNPTLWMGIWNTITPGWVSGVSASGNYPDINGTREAEFGAGQNTGGKIASFSMGNPDGHNLSAFRDAFVNTAIVTIADADSPSMDPPIGPSKWVNQIPTEPITVTGRDLGLGIYRLKVSAENVPQSSGWPVQTMPCTGTTVYPCKGANTFNLTRHGEGAGEVRDYDPSVMPQGADNVLLTAEDPLGNKSETKKVKVWVDHSGPVLAPLSGTLTEQAKVGTNASQYTLKYSATDGDGAAAAALAPFGEAGTTEGKTQRPLGVAVDASGNVWVADRDNNRVEKFDENGKFLMQFGKLGSGNGEFNDPRGIAISSNGTVWVTEVGNKRVQAFDSEGKFVRKIVSTGSAPFSEPYGVATGPEGVLWVSDAAGQTLYKFREADGTFLTKATGSAANPSGGSPDFSGPVGLAADAKGNVWVVENGTHRVQKFDSSGKYVLRFGTMGSGDGQLKFPVGVGIAPSGNVMVVDAGNNRVQEFQPNGVYLRQFGATGSGNGQLSEPRGIAVNSAGTAFIADASNHRISKWNHADLNRQSGVVSTEVKVDGTLVEPKYAPGCATENCSITNKEWTLKSNTYGSGQHEVQITAVDGVGLKSIKQLSFGLGDIETIIDSSPGAVTNSVTPMFVFHSNYSGASFECRIDALAWTACQPTSFSPASALSVGTHSFEVRASNQWGGKDGSPASRTFLVDPVSPEMTFSSSYKAAGPTEYTLQIHATDPGAANSGVQRIDVLLNGKVEASFGQSCTEKPCPQTVDQTWAHAFSRPLTGEDHLAVITLDKASNSTTSAFDIPSKIVRATIYTGDPAGDGTSTGEEWSQLATHNARLQETSRTITRGNTTCPQAGAEVWCSTLRTTADGRFSEVTTPISKPTAISEAGTLSLPSQVDFGQVTGSGALSAIRQPWQVLPPGAGTVYEVVSSENNASEPKGQAPQVAGQWTFWIDSATKLPIKASLREGVQTPQVAYYSYSSSVLEAGNLSPTFFLQNRPTREDEGCIESGQLGGWTYNEAGFTYPDPRFNSVVNTDSGPLLLRPEGAAGDGFQPRATLTADGVELAESSSDVGDLRWEFTQSPDQTLEPAGPDVVVLSDAGMPSAIIQPSTVSAVEVVDGQSNPAQGESGDEIILEPTTAGTNAHVQSAAPQSMEAPCITAEMTERAEVVHQEAVAAGVVRPMPNASSSSTTTVDVWINPHPALKGVSVSNQNTSCNSPHSKTFGEDGHVVFGGCPVGKASTFAVPNQVSANGTTYTVGEPSRTIKPPSSGWSISYNYTAQAPPPPPPPPPPPGPEHPHELQLGGGEVEADGASAEISSENPIPIPAQFDCYLLQTRPWRSDVAFPNQVVARAKSTFRCREGSFIDSWWAKWHISRWVAADNQWQQRSFKEPRGLGPATTNQGPYFINAECRALDNLLTEPEKRWRSEATLWALGEYPNGTLYGVNPYFYATGGKTLSCG